MLGALSAREGRLFAAETLLPTPVPDDQLSEQDKSLQWEVETPEKLFEDHAVRLALVVFANNKASTIGDLWTTPRFLSTRAMRSASASSTGSPPRTRTRSSRC